MNDFFQQGNVCQKGGTWCEECRYGCMCIGSGVESRVKPTKKTPRLLASTAETEVRWWGSSQALDLSVKAARSSTPSPQASGGLVQ